MSHKFTIDGLLTRKRECKADWLALQAECLSRFAKEHGSTTALVYAALEARNAIEQLFLELILTSQSGAISKEMLTECRKNDGVFRVMEKCEPNYRKMVQFMEIIKSINPDYPALPKWDLGKLKSFHNKLSKYCHFQGHESDTIISPLNIWLSQGISLVEEIFCYFENEMANGYSAAIWDKASLPSEVAEAFEEFKQNKIEEENLKIRLQLMQPVLRQRRIFRSLC